jgi:hypothetical protein
MGRVIRAEVLVPRHSPPRLVFLPPVFVLEANMSNFEHAFENETVRHTAWLALSAATLATFFMTVFSW